MGLLLWNGYIHIILILNLTLEGCSLNTNFVKYLFWPEIVESINDDNWFFDILLKIFCIIL